MKGERGWVGKYRTGSLSESPLDSLFPLTRLSLRVMVLPSRRTRMPPFAFVHLRYPDRFADWDRRRCLPHTPPGYLLRRCASTDPASLRLYGFAVCKWRRSGKFYGGWS